MRRALSIILATAAAGLAGLAGCSGATSARILVERGTRQPGRKLESFTMTTEQAVFNRTEDGWDTVLLSFPLPGSATRPFYFLYMRFRPVKDLQDFSMGGGSQALFVEASRTAGRPNEVSLARTGQVIAKMNNRGFRMIGYFDLHCPDGKRLSGKFDATYRSEPILEFEEVYLKTDVPAPPPPDEPAPPALPPPRPPGTVGLAARDTRTHP